MKNKGIWLLGFIWACICIFLAFFFLRDWQMQRKIDTWNRRINEAGLKEAQGAENSYSAAFDENPSSQILESQAEQNGYLMMDGSGYFFLQMENTDASSFKDNVMNGKEVTGFKFEFNNDSIAQLPLHYDTLVDLNTQEKGFPSAYIYKRIAPVEIVYSADSVIEPYLKGKLSYPIRFDKGEFTLVYKPAGIKVTKITPVKKE